MSSLHSGRCKDCELLRAELSVVREENRVLREEIRVLKGRIDSVESSAVRKSWYKPSVKPLEEKKKPGRKEGHVGAGRRKPEHVDEVVKVGLECCPGCKNPLGDSYSVRSRYVYEVPPPSLVKVIEYQMHRYWCANCRRNVEAHPDEFPFFRLGRSVWEWAYVMHHQLNVGYDKIAWWMRETWRLPVTSGALTQGLDSLAEQLNPSYEGMIEDLRDSPYCHADETGCRVDGVNWWTWVFRTEDQILYHTEHSRGSKVPEKILGKDYCGGIVSDDYSAYSPLKYLKQADWVHLIRKARDLTEKKNTHPEHKRLYHQLQRVYHDLKEYLDKPPPQRREEKTLQTI